jgi:prophage tail gpP-like protein
MSDKVSLIIAGKEIESFESYRVASDLFEAADAFSMTMADPDIRITRGDRCKLIVNGLLELNGIIDKVSRSYDKGARTLSIEGRDLMGLVVDSYCTEFPGLKNTKLSDLARRLLGNIPYVNQVKVEYRKGDKRRSVLVTRQEEEYEYAQIKPGQTVFDVLKQKALEDGRLFFSLPDGTFIFGSPATGGKAQFSFITTKDGLNNNVLSATLTEDIGRSYKTVKVMGQRQGNDETEAGGQNVLATVTNQGFPFTKPYVATIEHDGQDPTNYARIILDSMRFDEWQLELKAPGHSQNGRNFQVNAVCHVTDEVLGVNADLLCYGRTYEPDKNGAFTTLKIGRLGVMPS